MAKFDRSKNRSDKYQHIIVESCCSPEILTQFAEAEGFEFNLSPEQNDKLLELREELRLAFWRLVDNSLTPRQRDVMHLYAEGKTQTEIAKILGVNQSSITKSINGNTDYRSGRKCYGGSSKKLKRLAEKDPEIQDILKKISELYEEE